MGPTNLSRRSFVVSTSVAIAAGMSTELIAADPALEHQAMGTRVGEVTPTSAIVWARLTTHPTRNNDGIAFERKVDANKKTVPLETTETVDKFQGACPGMAGRLRIRYSTHEDLSEAAETTWADVTEASDFIHQFPLKNLKPATRYHYVSEATGANGKPTYAPFRGQFETAPAAETPSDLTFCVMTCQGYPDRGHPDGHAIYPAMLALKPKFASLTGDLVYYDNDAPQAVTARLARYHWERMFSLPRLVEFNRNVATYWLKDDHDTLSNDTWPGRKIGEFTFEEGQKIFRQQAPLTNGPSYRTFRWGRDLQIWFTDGRDYRSPNKMPDGPTKTIWGAEQKEWFKKTVKESTAAWKILISPTPLVGPDRKMKNDNHSNEGFKTEGDEIRTWLKENVPNNFFVICGDRHWQYHSAHPETGLNEFSVGAASNEHAGGTPGLDKAYHKFHLVKGGFLSVTLKPEGDRSTISFEHRDVNGKVVYSWSPKV